MSQITLEDAETRLAEVIAQGVPGEEIAIVQGERVVATLIPAPMSPASPRQPGSAQGSILYMAPDFDAPLDDFKEYME